MTEKGYKAARGCAPIPPGGLSPEDAIARGRGDTSGAVKAERQAFGKWLRAKAEETAKELGSYRGDPKYSVNAALGMLSISILELEALERGEKPANPEQ